MLIEKSISGQLNRLKKKNHSLSVDFEEAGLKVSVCRVEEQ